MGCQLEDFFHVALEEAVADLGVTSMLPFGKSASLRRTLNINNLLLTHFFLIFHFCAVLVHQICAKIVFYYLIKSYDIKDIVGTPVL